MKKLLLLILLTTACSLDTEINPSSKTSPRCVVPPTDYTDNLYDDWAANRGLVPDANSVYVTKWIGLNRGTSLTAGGSPSFPNGFLQVDINDYYSKTGGDTLHHANTDVTILFNIRKAAKSSKAIVIFDSKQVQLIRLYMEISPTNQHIGISFATNVIIDTGVTFPYGDGQFHVFGFRTTGNIVNVLLDGVKIGNNVTMPSSSITWNATNGQYMSFIGGGATGSPLLGDIKRFRLYTQSLNDSLVNLVSHGDFINDIVDTTPCHLIIGAGQSNLHPTLADNIAANYPSGMMVQYDRQFLMNFSTLVFSPMQFFVTQRGGGVKISGGPNVSLVYNMNTDFPSDKFYYVDYNIGDTGMYPTNGWNSRGVSASLYNNLIRYIKSAKTILAIEQRNVVDITLTWYQGEWDMKYSYAAAVYFDNLTNFKDDIRIATGINKIISYRMMSNYSLFYGPYRNQVLAAMDSVAAHDPNFILINSDAMQHEPTTIHLKTPGSIDFGNAASLYITP